MSDYIDQLFNNVNTDRWAATDKLSEEDILEKTKPVVPPEQQQQQQQPKAAQAGLARPTDVKRTALAGNDPTSALSGFGKWMEENINIPIVDMLDPNRNAEEVAQDRAKLREDQAQYAQEVRENAGNEVGRTILGAGAGAAELVLNAGEILGDTGKVAASKVFPSLYQVADEQDPFSSKYQWASWDLGKDEIGAQTGIGQVAQGFLEFGIIMGGTGGFGGLPAAGTKFAAATTTLGKAGVLAQAGALGAISGLAADMLSATRGEGNLSNLIRDNAPEWYPTWLTALAVDEDDSPWEAMLKTGLEGMGIGGAADAVGAYIGGVREARRILKAGGSEDEAAEAAIEVSQQILDNATPAASTRTTLSPEQYVQELEAVKASDPAMYWSVDSVDLSKASEGRVITVEGGGGMVGPDGDIKGVYKLPDGPKGVGDAVIQEAIRQGGTKLDNFDLPNLRKIYERNGFRVTGSMPFDPQYAPPGWDEALHGKPNVVAMVYDPDGKLRLPDDPQGFTDYDEMIAHRDRQLNVLGNSYRGDRSVRDQLSVDGYADYNVRLPNGNKVEFRLNRDYDIQPAYDLPNDVRILEVSWDMGGDDQLIGPHGRRIMSSFQNLARTELEPGTVLVNYPASDGYGRPASEAQSRRSIHNNPALNTIPDDLLRERHIEDNLQRLMQELGTDEATTRRYLTNQYNDWGAVTRNQLYEDLYREDADFRQKATEWFHERANTPRDQRSIRERLYSRAGFGPVSEEGAQLAVVRSTPDGRGRWLTPIDPSDPAKAVEAIKGQKPLLNQAQETLRASFRDPNSAVARAEADDYNAEYWRGSGDTPESWAAGWGDRTPWEANPEGFRNQVLNSAAERAMAESPRAQAIEALIRQSREGIPITWDDAATVVPEYFSPGARELTEIPADIQQAHRFISESAPTVVDLNGNVIELGGSSPYLVPIDGKTLQEFSPEAWDDFLVANAEILSRDDAALRFTKQGNKVTAELVRMVPDENEARFLGLLFDLEEIHGPLNTPVRLGGSGSLADTKGDHIGTRFGTPMESRPVDSTTAINQQMTARNNPTGGRGGSQPTVTRAQLRRIANAVGEEPTNILRQMVRENPVDLSELSSVSRQSVDEVTAEALQGIQDALGQGGDIDFTKILSQVVGDDTLLTRAGIVQVRGLMQELSNGLYDAGYSIMKMGEANMDAFPQVQRMAENLKALTRIHKESANAYSRYLSTYKIKVPGLGVEIPNPFKPPTVEELVKEIKNVDKVLDELITKMASGDPKARAEAFRIANALVLSGGDPSKVPTVWKYIKQIASGQALNMMYNSMLSGPKTHVINTLSNAFNTIYRPLAAAAGGDIKIKKAAAASLYGMQTTITDAFDMAAMAMKDGPISDGSKTLLAAEETSQKLKLLQQSAEVSADPGFKAAVGVVGMMHDIANFPLFSWPSKLLTSADEFFKTMVARMEYNSQTMLKAIDESAGSNKPLQETFERMLKDGWEKSFDLKTGAIKDDSLLRAAKDATFQNELEGWAKSFGTFINEVPILRVFFPFVKTGHNIMVYAGSHVPVLNRALSEYKTVMAGNDAYAKAVWKGREAYGRLLVVGGGLLAFNGAITGNGPPDIKERKVWEKSNQPRSFNLTKLSGGAIKGKGGKDKFLDYSRIEPFGQILSAIADLTDMVRSGQMSEDRGQYLAGYLTYAIASNFTNKSYMQGVVPLGQILTPGWQGLNALQALPATTLNNFIPLSGARRTLANMLTPYMQEYNNQVDRLLYQATGGFAPLASPMHDWLTGEPIPALGGGVNALMPLASTERGGNKVHDALEDIEFDSSVIMKSLVGIKLDRQHRSRLQQLMGQSGLQKELEAWVTKPTFKEAVDDFRTRLRSGERLHKENEPFYDHIVDTITKYRDSAVQQLRTEFPELNSQILESRMIRSSQRKGQKQQQAEDLNNLVNMPLK